MMTFRFRGRIAAWFALAAIALNAFWPVIANARPAESTTSYQICSATGLRHGDSPDGNPLSLRCALCVFHAGHGVAITPTTSAPAAPETTTDDRPAPVDEPRLEAAFDPAAPPRAPPFPS